MVVVELFFGAPCRSVYRFKVLNLTLWYTCNFDFTSNWECNLCFMLMKPRQKQVQFDQQSNSDEVCIRHTIYGYLALTLWYTCNFDFASNWECNLCCMLMKPRQKQVQFDQQSNSDEVCIRHTIYGYLRLLKVLQKKLCNVILTWGWDMPSVCSYRQ